MNISGRLRGFRHVFQTFQRAKRTIQGAKRLNSRIFHPPGPKLAYPGFRKNAARCLNHHGIGGMAGNQSLPDVVDVGVDAHVEKTSRKLLDGQAANGLDHDPSLGCMKKTPKQVLADNIRHLRSLKGWSQSELARRSGIPQRTISAIENAVHNTGVEHLESLGKALSIPAWALLFTEIDPALFQRGGLQELIVNFIALPDDSKQEVKHVANREKRYFSCNSKPLELPTTPPPQRP